MISFSQIITRLKAQCPSFQQRVGASVSFAATLNNSEDIATPHCFVMPKDFKDFSLIDYDVTFPETLKIKVTKETFQTVICIDNSANRGAKDGGTKSIIPLDLLTQIQTELEAAFTGWKPTNLEQNAGEINLSGGEYTDSDNRLLWYVFEWSILYRRGSGGLTPAQQAEIDAIVNGADVLGTLNRVVIRNNESQDGLQPVANAPLDNGDYPDGAADPAALEAALQHADRDENPPPTDADLAVTGDDLIALKSGEPPPTQNPLHGIEVS